MGRVLGQLCYELRNDFDWLRAKWGEFRELYGRGQESIDVLNAVASNFFYFLHKLMFEDAMLHLCRLTDPPRMRDRETLSVAALVEAVSDVTLKVKVQTKLEEVRGKCEFARRWRNRSLAHTDLVTLRGPVPALPPVNSGRIDAALKSIDEILWLVERHFGLPPIVMVGDPWGAKSLVYYLKRGRLAVDQERRSWIALAKGHGQKQRAVSTNPNARK